MEATEDTQHFRLTLKMELETHDEFLVMIFDGQGTLQQNALEDIRLSSHHVRMDSRNKDYHSRY